MTDLDRKILPTSLAVRAPLFGVHNLSFSVWKSHSYCLDKYNLEAWYVKKVQF